MLGKPIAITPGEPAGIGTEITVKAWKDKSCPPFFLIDDAERVTNRAKEANLEVPIKIINTPEQSLGCFIDALPILPHKFPIHCKPGKPVVLNAQAVIESIEIAVRYAKSGLVSAIVTNPIQKDILTNEKFQYPGHTEFLAALCGTELKPVMLLASDELFVVPVTIHEPLSNVPKILNESLLQQTILITNSALKTDFSINSPRLCVSGLNPHAGENGTIGLEEEQIIKPVIESLKNRGLRINGPVSADAMFTKDARMSYDIAICMYHDQALIPIKTLDFWNSVNVTIGLPIVRTSPDHGTALNLAGSGDADANSMITAIKLAHKIYKNRLAGLGFG